MNETNTKIPPLILIIGSAAALAMAVLPPLVLGAAFLWFITPFLGLLLLAGVFARRSWLACISATLELAALVAVLARFPLSLSAEQTRNLYSTGQVVKADVYYLRADYVNALAAYRQSISSGLEDPWLYYQMGKCYNYLGQSQPAFETFVYVDKYPQKVPQELLRLDFALACIKSNFEEEGANAFKDAIKSNYNPGYCYYQLGVYYTFKRDPDKAEEMFSNAHFLGYQRSECSSLLGGIAEGRKDYAKAEKLYRRGLRESFENLTLYAKLGSLLHRTGRNDEAVSILLDGFNLSALVRYNPRAAAMILNNLGFVYADQRKTGQAIMAFKQSIHTDAGFMESYYNLAYVLMQEKRNTEALEILRMALDKDPNDATAREMIAQILGSGKPQDQGTR
ncbi:tetratricopeptide repeat protein [bacterium]|nr:tetratricopeptide repeat protein [bacterium]